MDCVNEQEEHKIDWKQMPLASGMSSYAVERHDVVAVQSAEVQSCIQQQRMSSSGEVCRTSALSKCARITVFTPLLEEEDGCS